jgi:putative aldouronate transport system substrate-binding protein
MFSFRDVDDIVMCRNGSMWFYDQVAELTNVNVNFEAVRGTDWEMRLNLMFAAGDLPDVIFGAVNFEEFGVRQGLLVPLDEYIERYMPIYSARLAMDPNAPMSLIASDGQMYALGNFISQDINSRGHWFINQAALTELGLEMPTTVDELTYVLRRFKEHGMVPYSAPNITTWSNSVLYAFSFWGIPMNERFFMLDDDQTLHFAAHRPGFREALEWLHMIYSEGLLHREALTQDSSLFEAMIPEDNTGLFVLWRLFASNLDDVMDNYVQMMNVSADGFQARAARTLELAAPRVFVTTANQNIPATLRWLDAQLHESLAFDGYHGPEGIGWDWQDGLVTVIEGLESGLVTSYSPHVNSFFYAPAEWYFEIFRNPPARIEKAEFSRAQDAAGVMEPYSWQLVNNVARRTPEEAERINQLFPDIQMTMREAITAFILNGVTDDSWNTFMSRLDGLRVDEYIEIFQTAYDRFMDR